MKEPKVEITTGSRVHCCRTVPNTISQTGSKTLACSAEVYASFEISKWVHSIVKPEKLLGRDQILAQLCHTSVLTYRGGLKGCIAAASIQLPRTRCEVPSASAMRCVRPRVCMPLPSAWSSLSRLEGPRADWPLVAPAALARPGCLPDAAAAAAGCWCGGVGGGASAACCGNSSWMVFHRAVFTLGCHPVGHNSTRGCQQLPYVTTQLQRRLA